MEVFSLIVLTFTLVTTGMFLCNLSAFRKSPVCDVSADDDLPVVSVLIPARDEAARIEATLRAVLATQQVQLEVIVLDDHSSDATAEIVERIADSDARVRLLRGKPLPSGWCGKQFACAQLARHASHDALLFLDADVRLAKDAIHRCWLQLRTARVSLLSGFPQQQVGTLGEALLIPLMYLVMLSYLPFLLMRRTLMPAASAGCGQLFLTTREAYGLSGGHGAIKSSLHDGVMLPRAYRRQGMRTDVFDASDIAQCRMYYGWRSTCNGLMKNAYEGIANIRLIVPFSCLLGLGYLAPAALLIYQLLWPTSVEVIIVSLLAATVSYLPRVLIAWRFDRSWLATAAFPLAILLFVVLQWMAFSRSLSGGQATWRGRAYAPVTT